MEGLASLGTPCDGPLDARGTARRGPAPGSHSWGAGAQTTGPVREPCRQRGLENALIRAIRPWIGRNQLRSSPQALRRFSQQLTEAGASKTDGGRKVWQRDGQASAERVFEHGTPGAGARLRRLGQHRPIRVLAEPNERRPRLTVDDRTGDPRPAAGPVLGLVHVLGIVQDHSSVSNASAVLKARHVPRCRAGRLDRLESCFLADEANRPRIR
jgi:hypothetical protein